MNQVKMAVFPSQLGWMGLTWAGRRIHALTFGHRSPRAAAKRIRTEEVEPGEPDAFARKLIKRLQAFARGNRRDDFLDVSIDTTDLTEFERKVIQACRHVAAGETATYGELARRIDHPGAARAVGRVMATNRFPLVVPCHRIIGAGGRLGGYSAADGLATKRKLLSEEGVTEFRG
jgi:methylated-DNA-[protein]-cysteine S-methyltransferase